MICSINLYSKLQGSLANKSRGYGFKCLCLVHQLIPRIRSISPLDVRTVRSTSIMLCALESCWFAYQGATNDSEVNLDCHGVPSTSIFPDSTSGKSSIAFLIMAWLSLLWYSEDMTSMLRADVDRFLGSPRWIDVLTLRANFILMSNLVTCVANINLLLLQH